MAVFLLFFCSGASGLVYEVIWVREFGNVFGNTVQSASLVAAVFMLGLGVGSLGAGVWADRQYARRTDSFLLAYAAAELAIAAFGTAISLVLPALAVISARGSSYVADATGWYVLSPGSYLLRVVVAIGLLAPVSLLMGATLTLLARDRIRTDRAAEVGWTIARLYGANTAGAAVGAFLTDFALVPAIGLRRTQLAAAALNAAAAAGALLLARQAPSTSPPRFQRASTPPAPRAAGSSMGGERPAIVPTGAALALSGFAGMGMEIVWIRHFTLLLGGFRSVVALALTTILAGIGLGALAGGVLARRLRPAPAWMLVQALLVAATLAGVGAAAFRAAHEAGAAGWPAAGSARWLADLWHNLPPILSEAGLPALLMGCSFPIANAIIQRAEAHVGRRAGFLYLANTSGAVAGSLAAGYWLLPSLGLQRTTTVLMGAAAAAILPLAMSDTAGFEPRRGRGRPPAAAPIAVSFAVLVAAMAAWLRLPADHVLRRSLAPRAADERLLQVREGLTEVAAVVEAPGRGRALVTNGHPMSSTALLDQRYMRALVHVPLLAIEHPTQVLVIGFGVGNSTHAAVLHPSIRRVEVADISRQVLDLASAFRDANQGVLDDPRVRVFVNDGRQHLQMQSEGTYDLITLEPPPVAHAGVAPLYSREFYALARSRLKPGGYLSQWLPAYQVPADTSLAMVRAFVDVFPQAVLLSGLQAELLLLGTNAGRIELDPGRLDRALEAAPMVRADLERLDLGTPTEIAGTFLGSAATLERATRGSPAVSDDRPLQEYAVRSNAAPASWGVPASLIDVSAVRDWCPRCFADGTPTPIVAGLDLYLGLLEESYRRPRARIAPDATRPDGLPGSGYLRAVVPDTGRAHQLLGLALLRQHRYREAAARFREALARGEAAAVGPLATALVAMGETEEAIRHLRRAVELDPDDAGAEHTLGSLLLERGQYAEARDYLAAALRIRPDSAAARNDLGIALASLGDLDGAIEEFRRALRTEPGFEQARRNLGAALRMRGRGSP